MPHYTSQVRQFQISLREFVRARIPENGRARPLHDTHHLLCCLYITRYVCPFPSPIQFNGLSYGVAGTPIKLDWSDHQCKCARGLMAWKVQVLSLVRSCSKLRFLRANNKQHNKQQLNSISDQLYLLCYSSLHSLQSNHRLATMQCRAPLYVITTWPFKHQHVLLMLTHTSDLPGRTLTS